MPLSRPKPAILRQINPVQGYAKYKQTKELIYNHLVRSGARPGEKICTEAVLIKELAISVTTARRALDELVREGILVRKVGKGTFLKDLDSRRKAASTVLLLGHNSWQFLREDVYYGRIVGALGTTLRDAGFRQVVLVNEWGRDAQNDLADIRRHEPAAIVYPYARHADKPFILALSTLGVPLMIYGHELDGLNAGQVFSDDRQGGAIAAEHLVQRGYTDLAVIAAPEESPAGQSRLSGFVQALQRLGSARLTGTCVADGYGEADGYRCVDGLLRTASGSRPRAIFCAGDLLAYGAIKRLQELDLAVPNDVAVMGYGDFQLSSLYHPKLTTVRMDLEQMGREIGAWVEQVTSPRDDAASVDEFVRRLPVELKIRKTT